MPKIRNLSGISKDPEPFGNLKSSGNNLGKSQKFWNAELVPGDGNTGLKLPNFVRPSPLTGPTVRGRGQGARNANWEN